MAMAARSPAAPPPTIRTSCEARTTPSLTSPLLVGQHLPVVVHHEAVAAAVVELLPAAAAATGVAQVLGDEALVVLGHVLLAAVPMTARREAWLEDGSGGTHGPSPSPGTGTSGLRRSGCSGPSWLGRGAPPVRSDDGRPRPHLPGDGGRHNRPRSPI